DEKWIMALVFSMVLFVSHTIMQQVGECQRELTVLMGVNLNEMYAPARPVSPTEAAENEKKKLIPFAVIGALGVVAFFAPAFAAAVYVRLRRVQREKALRDAALIAAADPDRYLETLRTALDYRFADVGFHLKYAEALVARGRHADAAVEARLILEQDPYNFS